MPQVIRLTEDQLHALVQESVHEILEEGWKNWAMAGALGAASMFGGNKAYAQNTQAQNYNHPNDSVNYNYQNAEHNDTVQTYPKYDNGLEDDEYWEETEDAMIHHPSTRHYEYPVDSLKQWFPNAYRDRNANPEVWKSVQNASAYNSQQQLPHGKRDIIRSGSRGQNPWLTVLKNYNREEYNRLMKQKQAGQGQQNSQ